MNPTIKNYIFDLGNVLVQFDPIALTAPYVQDPDTRELISQTAFDRLYWDRLDLGTITDEELKAACHTRLPRNLHGLCDNAYDHWVENLTPFPGMQELLLDVKAAGNRIFLLSNISIGFTEQYRQVPMLRELLSHFDGLVFSGPLGIVKPSKEIFLHLLETYGLQPEETIFIDDSAKNVAGAQAVGIHGYHFDGDTAKLRNYLKF